MISDWRSEVTALLNLQLRGRRLQEDEEDEDVDHETETDGWNNYRAHVTSGKRRRLNKKEEWGREDERQKESSEQGKKI